VNIIPVSFSLGKIISIHMSLHVRFRLMKQGGLLAISPGMVLASHAGSGCPQKDKRRGTNETDARGKLVKCFGSGITAALTK